MAYTEERKIWLDKNGKVLVDKDGKPFYTISCCCGSTCCWQLYEASCVDAEGRPGWINGVYNSNAAEPRHWTTPQLVNYTCTTDCAGKALFDLEWNIGDKEGAWILQGPGRAYCLLKRTDIPVCSVLHVDEQGNSSWEVPCSRPAAFVPPPDIPCSCESLSWGYISRGLPYAKYINMVFVVSTMYRENVDNLYATCIGSSLFSVWDLPPGLPCSDTHEQGAVWYNVGFRAGFAYSYMNYMPSPLLDRVAVYQGPSCTDSAALSPDFYRTNAAAKEWLAPYLNQLRTSTLVAVRYNGLDGVESYLDPASSVYRFPFNTDYMFAKNKWVSNLSVFTLGKLPDDTWGTWCVGSVVESQLYTEYIATCRVISGSDVRGGWSCFFDKDQWGALIVSAGSGNATLHWVREAVGADCAYPDTPTATGVIKPGEQVILDGSPLWFYRTYLTTELPLDDINNWNRHCIARTNYNSKDTINPDEVRFSFHAQALKCAQYNFLLCVQGQNCCFNDPPNMENFGLAPYGGTGSCCAPYYHKEYVIQRGERRPAEFLWRDLSYNRDETSLMHEAEESVDENGNSIQGQPFREFDHRKDGHLYYISRLTIDNYPRWKTGNLCTNSLNANLYDVPKVDFSYDAQLCIDRHIIQYNYPASCFKSPECAWPKTNLKLIDSFLDHKYTGDGYGVPGVWYSDPLYFYPEPYSLAKRQSDISPIGQLCSDAYGQECTTSLVSVFKAINTKVSTYKFNANGEVRNTTYCEFDLSDWWRNGKGCPNYIISGVVSLELEHHVYSSGTHHEFKYTSETRLWDVAFSSTFMWEGRFPDYADFPGYGGTDFAANSFPAYPVTNMPNKNTTYVTSLLGGGVYFYQEPNICCTSDNNDSDGDI